MRTSIIVAADDPAAFRDYYRELGVDVASLEWRGDVLRGMQYGPLYTQPDQRVPEVLRGRLAFPVDDIDQKVEKIAKRGFRVLMPVTEVGGNPFAVTGDPFGNVVALYTPFAS